MCPRPAAFERLVRFEPGSGYRRKRNRGKTPARLGSIAPGGARATGRRSALSVRLPTSDRSKVRMFRHILKFWSLSYANAEPTRALSLKGGLEMAARANARAALYFRIGRLK